MTNPAEQPTLPPPPPDGAATLAPGPGWSPASAAFSPGPAGYELLEELGRGGMGVVYRARQTGLGRAVALKMILAGGHAGGEERDRFRLEAESLARLQHPGIVQVFEVGEWEGRAFLALEFCPGGSLEKSLAGTPLGAGQAASLVRTLAEAVHAAHTAGVIHRDLKPANVLLARDGLPKITDFGLAKRLDGDSGATRTGTIMGTPSYMAPEQAQGRKDVGPAADVYALGAILYECLTGRPPFRAATPLDTVLQVLDRDPVAPRVLAPAVPRDLETVCLKCLHKDPARRYPSAQDLADDLNRFLKGEPVQARPAGLIERAIKWVRRKPTAAALVLVSAAAAGALLAGAAAFTARLRAERDVAQTERDAAQAERDRARRTVYGSGLALAQVAWRAGDIDRLGELLDASPPDLRGFEWHYLARLLRQDARRPVGHAKTVIGVGVLPDGTPVSAGADGLVKCWNVARGTVPREVRHTAPVTSFACQGGRAAVGYRDGAVQVWSLTNLARAASLPDHGGPVTAVALSPDGRQVATGTVDGRVRVWDCSSGAPAEPSRNDPVHEGRVSALAWSPDGSLLASGGWDRQVRVRDRASGDAVSAWAHAFTVTALAFDPAGRCLASASLDATVSVRDPRSGREMKALKGHRTAVFAVAFNPDGSTVASAGHDQMIKLWDPATGQERRTLTGHGGIVNGVAFSPDGKSLVSGAFDQTVRVWPLGAPERPPVVLFGQRGQAPNPRIEAWPSPEGVRGMSLAFSPDGARLAVGGGDGAVQILSHDGGDGLQRVRALGDPGAPVMGVAWSPGGDLIAAAGAEGRVRVLRAGTGQALFSTQGHEFAVMAVAFSPDGRTLASAGLNTVARLWDAATGAPGPVLRGHQEAVLAVAYAPAGDWLATASYDGTVRLWDAGSGTEVARFTAEGVVQGVAVAPDGRTVAGACWDGTARLWDVATGRARVIRAHTRELTACRFSPDGGRLLTAGWDNSAKVWDVATGQELLTLTGHRAPVLSVDLRGDGTQVAGVGADGRVLLWDGTPAGR